MSKALDDYAELYGQCRCSRCKYLKQEGTVYRCVHPANVVVKSRVTYYKQAPDKKNFLGKCGGYESIRKSSEGVGEARKKVRTSSRLKPEGKGRTISETI